MRLLFLCSQNRLRSPTAERLFSSRPGIEARSAGVDPDAVKTVTHELIEWADLIFVMERWQREELTRGFPECLAGKRVVCLDIPDEYLYMDPELVRLLEAKVPPFLAEA